MPNAHRLTPSPTTDTPTLTPEQVADREIHRLFQLARNAPTLDERLAYEEEIQRRFAALRVEHDRDLVEIKKLRSWAHTEQRASGKLREQLRETSRITRESIRRRETEIRRLQAKIKSHNETESETKRRLTAALLRHGDHKRKCAVEPCTCGFTRALAEMGEEK